MPRALTKVADFQNAQAFTLIVVQNHSKHKVSLKIVPVLVLKSYPEI